MTDQSLEFVPSQRSFRIISQILKNLFTPEGLRLDREITELNKLNNFKLEVPVDGFMFDGTYYRPRSIPPSKVIHAQLHQEFRPRMENYIRDRAIIAEDLVWIRQILFNLLEDCESFQDIRDALPDCLSDTMPELHMLNRTRPEAYTIADNSRAMRSYNKLKPKLQLYSVSKMFY